MKVSLKPSPGLVLGALCLASTLVCGRSSAGSAPAASAPGITSAPAADPPSAAGPAIPAAVPASAAGPAVPAADPRIQLDEPKPGQVFRPGDTLAITLRILPPLREKVTDVLVSVSIAGMLPAPPGDWRTKVFHWTFPIPQAFAGPLEVSPYIVAGEDPAHPGQPLLLPGPPVTVAVRSSQGPDTLTLLDHYFSIPWRGGSGTRTEHLYVRGTFGGIERDLTAPEAGTTYTSSNPAVAAADPDGSVRILGPGIATVTAANGSAKDMASFKVEDLNHPLPAQDLSAQVRFTVSAPVLDPTALAYRTYPLTVQTVTLTNGTDQPLVGPLYLVVGGLPDGVELWIKVRNLPPNVNPFGRFQTGKGKPPAIRLVPKDGLNLEPGEEITQNLYFLIPGTGGTVPKVSLSLLRSTLPP